MSKKRSAGGPRAAAHLLARITSPAFRRRGFAESEVLLRWSAIVGPELARLATPEKLSFQRGSAAGGTLHVRVSGALALELQHMAPTVIERVNSYYGYRAVDRLHLVQAPPAVESRRERRAAPALPAAARARLEDSLEGTRNPRLRAALARLGERVLARQAGGRGPR